MLIELGIAIFTVMINMKHFGAAYYELFQRNAYLGKLPNVYLL